MNSKIITFSFDDGIEDDFKLVEILNKYNLKATFNLNSAKLTGASTWVYNNVKTVKQINYFQMNNIYEGHEIASHGYSHQFMEKLDSKTLNNEILLDRKLLSYLFECEVKGFAYPYGTYSTEVIDALRDNGIKYARTVKSTYSFNPPENVLELNPTCHFKYSKLNELADSFLNMTTDTIQIFYVWGHSYELVTPDDWNYFEEFCKKVSGKSDIKYLTNIEAIDFINATESDL